ncbi:uncharacterized protein J3R85_020248 [Psidium guajava]|nr:uncharacterized protein J3R85_020248 [Psidium guajava]
MGDPLLHLFMFGLFSVSTGREKAMIFVYTSALLDYYTS